MGKRVGTDEQVFTKSRSPLRYFCKNDHAVLFLNEHLPRLRTLARRFGVRRLYAYGSVLTEQFRADSDVDLLVEFDETGLQPEEIGQRYWDLLDALEKVPPGLKLHFEF